MSRACRGTPRNCGHRINLPSFPLSGLQVPDQAFGELGNVRGEAGRGEVETENYAHRGVPYSQSRVPAKQEYHHAEKQRQRYRYRQLITPSQWRSPADVFRASYSTREPLRFQCGTSAVPVRLHCGCSAVRPPASCRETRGAPSGATTEHARRISRIAARRPVPVRRTRTARRPCTLPDGFA